MTAHPRNSFFFKGKSQVACGLSARPPIYPPIYIQADLPIILSWSHLPWEVFIFFNQRWHREQVGKKRNKMNKKKIALVCWKLWQLKLEGVIEEQRSTSGIGASEFWVTCSSCLAFPLATVWPAHLDRATPHMDTKVSLWNRLHKKRVACTFGETNNLYVKRSNLCSLKNFQPDS